MSNQSLDLLQEVKVKFHAFYVELDSKSADPLKGLKICCTELLKKNQIKIFWTFGQFEFEHFGGSDVVNKL